MDGLILNTGGTSGTTHLRLDGPGNWCSWKFQVKVILKALNVFGVVDGSVPCPNVNDQQKEKWLQMDAKAQGVIVTRLSNTIMIQVSNCETAKGMWDKLHIIYEQKSDMSLHLAYQKFFELKYKPEEGVSLFLAHIEEVVGQLKQMKGEVSESMVITKIVSSLPEQYRNFVSAWDSVPAENRTLSELTARILVEEQRNTALKENDKTAFAAKTVRKCFKCGKVGHVKKDCYLNKKRSHEKYCKHCNKAGHLTEQCWFKKDVKTRESQNAFIVSAMTASEKDEVDSKWYLDSGASEHMCHSIEYFSNYEQLLVPRHIMIGDGSVIKAVGIGQIRLEAYNCKNWIPTTLNDVLHVPELKVNLFSVSSALDKSYKMMSDNNECKFVKENSTCAIAKRQSKMYVMMFRQSANTLSHETAIVGCSSEGLSEWHSKMAHQNIDQVKHILRRSNIPYDFGEEKICIPCLQGKQHKFPFQLSEKRAERPGQLLHMDLCGPMECTSLGGSKYFLLIKDDHSRYRKVYFLRNKSETVSKIKEFVQAVKVNPGHTIEIIRSDNGKEFCNNEMKKLVSENGIQHQTSVVYTPEQNGCAEREMRTVVEAARSMLFGKNLSKNLWAEAVNTAVFILNRTGKSRVKDKTPYEIWFGREIYNITGLKIFGTKVAVHVPDQKRQKWDSKTEFGIFVGYGENIKGYRIFLPDREDVVVRKDVIFIQDVQEDIPCDSEVEKKIIPCVGEVEKDIIPCISEVEGEHRRNVNDGLQETSPATIQRSTAERNVELIGDNEDLKPIGAPGVTNPVNNTPEEVISSKRQRRKPTWLNDYDTDTSFFSMHDEPVTFKEAMKRDDKDKWSEAIQRELSSLEENNTWAEVTEVPEGTEIINSKWVFKVKENFDGNIQYKARLVARGFEQTLCDSQVYTPVAKLTTFRTFMAVANKMKLPVYQMDVTCAFLHGEIEEVVYMKLPDEKICKLNKSIYGLKKSPKYWNKKFDSFMLKENFIKSKNDLCLYSTKQNNEVLYVLIYVDDLLIFGSNETKINNFKNLLCSNFKMKDLGLACNYLGINIQQDLKNNVTIMDQGNYLKKLLEKFHMSNCKSINTPIEQNFNFELLKRDKSENDEIENSCRKLIGSLLYACSGARPDLCVAVGFLSRYQHCASQLLFKCLKRVLRYIRGTLDLSLIYHCNDRNEIQGNVDADWAGDTKDRKSTSGYMFKIFNCPVSWCSKKQLSVSLSSTEAEYIALTLAITEACWLKNLLLDFDCKLNVEIFEDNQSVIKIAENNESNKRLKHIDIKFHFIVEKILSGVIKLSYIKSSDNTADMFTKPLGKQLFEKFRDSIFSNKVLKEN